MRLPQISNSRRSALHASAALLSVLAACAAPATNEVDHSSVQAHNQRPFIGRDTYTTADSFFEIEAGVDAVGGRETNTPVLLKYGLGARTEFYAGTTPYTKVDRDELLPDGSGWGDSLVGVRHRFRDRDMYQPAYAFQIGTKLPTASKSKGLGTGELDFLGALMAQQSYYGTEVAAFYQLGLLGDPSGSGTDIEHTLSAQGRRPLNEQLAGFTELAFVWQPDINLEELTLMGGVAFVIDDFTLFDVGARVGITDDAPDFQVLFGLTRTLGLLAFPDAAGSDADLRR